MMRRGSREEATGAGSVPRGYQKGAVLRKLLFVLGGGLGMKYFPLYCTKYDTIR